MSLENNSNLTPSTLYGKGDNGNVSMQVSPTGIILGGDLNTATPITATISQAGIITDNPTGFDILSSLNMNQNNITNVGSIINEGNDLLINTGASLLDINISAGSVLNLTGDSVNINGSAYPPVVPVDTLNAVLTAGNIAIDKDLILRMNAGSVGDTGLILINDDTSPTETTKLYPTEVRYDDSYTTFTASWIDIINSANAGTPNIQQVLDAGATATSNLTLNNNGVGNNVINLFPNATTNNPQIILTDGTTTNTIDKNGYTTRNSVQNSTHYINFSDNSATGTGAIQKTTGLSCNPSTNTITATTFIGALTGTSTNSTNSTITDDNTNATFYPVFVSNNTGNLPLKVDKTTNPLSYNPSTGSLTATTFTGLCSTSGLVYLSTSQIAITGSASTQNLSFTSIFNSTYQNYRVVLNLASQVSFTSYPAYFLQAFTGTGVPTTASLYGNELTSSASSTISAVYTAGATISSAPLIFAVSSLTNKQVVIEVENVGFANTSANIVSLKCKSFYSNPGVVGYSDRNIVATSLSGATITGLTIQQSALGAGNNMTLQAVVYGYK